ncbi:MAG: PIG-L family deacetylase [Bacteroidota bacterium]
MRIFLVLGLTICFHVSFYAQSLKSPTSAELHHKLQKLNFLGTALYVAAHPDDENTRLIAYLSNHTKAHTTYLSLTRGDGGQNLIGPELRELLGVLRTQELLGARRVDGGHQLFSRANDFGFSKNPDETLNIWDNKEVLADVVWAIRQLKPDIIINRFDHRTPGTTHGHHTASAMLSVEAFDLANRTDAYADQLSYTETWQPSRLFFNTSWWFYGSREKFAEADKSNLVSMDIGVYYPALGISNNEIASLASSQHLCQGFGRLSQRGSQEEYVELLKGDMPKDNNLFEGINTKWDRMEGGAAIGDILYKVENEFNYANPSVHVPDLVKAYTLLQQSKDEHWKKMKSEPLKELILEFAGIFLEANSKASFITAGSSIPLKIEAINRSAVPVSLKTLQINEVPESSMMSNLVLAENQKNELTLQLEVPAAMEVSGPYWLKSEGTLGMYQVEDRDLIGKPETPDAFTLEAVLDIDGTTISFTRPVQHRFSKPDEGELIDPFVISPKVSTKFKEKVVVFPSSEPKTVQVKVKAYEDNLEGTLSLEHPEGWTVLPQQIPFDIKKTGEEINLTFTVTPSIDDSTGFLKAVAKVSGEKIDKELVEINYNHIPKQTVLLPSQAKVVRTNIQKTGEHIGYIMGAGDKIPESLEQIGFKVHTIALNSLEPGDLDKYDAVVVGIRAYNVIDALKFKQPYLLNYVEQGGNLIVQYNTAGRWRKQFDNIAPYPLTISRDRVTDEKADVEILSKDHAIVNFPNKITEKDFEDWVQERGLYFPNQWAPEFTPVLAMGDTGEGVKKGSLLVASYGKGHYIYTGLSFFRELPAGVPGAYRIFANMLSLGKTNVVSDSKIKG